VAVGAFALYEPIWEEAFVVETVELGYAFRVDVSVLLDFEIEIADETFVDSALCSGVVIEFDLKGLEKIDDEFVVLVSELAWRNAELDRFNLDRGPMLVATADHDDVFAFQSKIACVNIGRKNLGEGS
jgi:hypothetical protein